LAALLLRCVKICVKSCISYGSAISTSAIR
jgi:hypothetical protein